MRELGRREWATRGGGNAELEMQIQEEIRRA